MRPRSPWCALLAGTWLLLRPPVGRIEEGAETTVQDNAPLVVWQEVGAYHSESECAQARDQTLALVQQFNEKRPHSQVWIEARWLHARCVNDRTLPRR